MAIKFNPLGIEGLDVTGSKVPVQIGDPITGSAGNSILTTDSSGNIDEKVLANGQLLIGSTGNEPQIAGLTGTASQVIVTNGPGSITLSLPQNIDTISSPTFNNLNLSGTLDVATITAPANLSLNPINNIDVNSKKIVNLANPTNNQDAATKKYVDDEIAAIPLVTDFEDVDFRISDDLDTSKKIAFQASGLTTATTRTITMPDADVDLGKVNTSIQADGSVAFSSNQSMGLNKLTNLLNPTNALDAANKAYVDSLVAGLDFQADVDDYVADANTTAPGVGLPAAATGQRYILASNTSSLNPAWGTITGVGDNDIVQFDGTSWFVAYDVSVEGEGALLWNRASNYFMRWDGTSWDEFGGLAGVTAGAGLDKTGNTLFVELDTTSGLEFDVPGDGGKLRVRVDNSTIERHSSGLRVVAAGITANELAANAVETAKILNNAVTGDKIRLNNNESLRARNAANSADINILKLDTSDLLRLEQTLIPNVDNALDLGSTSVRYRDIYVTKVENSSGALSLNASTHISANNLLIKNVANPVNDQDAATKKYVDDEIDNIPLVTDFLDNVFRISDDVDNTKKIAFQASGISTGTVRTITMPNADVNLGNLANTDLSNLVSPTAINQDLVPDNNLSRKLGSGTNQWGDIYGKRLLNEGSNPLDLASYGSNGRILLYSDMTATENGIAIQDWNTTNAVPLLFFNGSGSNFVGLKAPNSLSTSSTYTLPPSLGSTGDVLTLGTSGQLNWSSTNTITRTVFTGAQNVVNGNVIGFLIPTGFDSFSAHVLVQVDATTDLNQVFKINGFFDGTNWILAQSHHGDNTLVEFSMNTSGQLLYSSGTYSGFSNLTITFKVDLI